MKFLERLRVFRRLAALEEAAEGLLNLHNVTSERVSTEIHARSRGDARLVDSLAAHVSALVVCAWGGEVLNVKSPHVLLMRNRRDANDLRACCRRCKIDATGDGYEAIDRTKKPPENAAAPVAQEASA